MIHRNAKSSAILLSLFATLIYASVVDAQEGLPETSKQIERSTTPVMPPEQPTLTFEGENLTAAPKIKPDENVGSFSSITIQGMTAFDADTITKKHLTPLLRKSLTRSDIAAMRRLITNYYLDADYIVLVHPRIHGGTLTFDITENPINRIILKGLKRSSPQTDAILNTIQNARILSKALLERQLGLLKRKPGTLFNAHFSGTTTAQSTSGRVLDLIIEAKQQEFSGIVSFFDTNSKAISEWHARLDASYYSALLDGDEVTCDITSDLHTHPHRYSYVALGYHMPIHDNGTRLHVSVEGSKINSDRIADDRTQGLDTTSYGLDLSLSHPFILRNHYSLLGNLGFAMNDGSSDWKRPDGAGSLIESETFHYKTRKLYLGSDIYLFDRLSAQNYIFARLSQGVDALGAVEHTADSFRLGEKNFTKLTMDYLRLQPINGSWYLYTAIKGQLSANRHIAPPERFTAGGAFAYGRGYKANEIDGTVGGAAMAELQYIHAKRIDLLNRATIFAFMDAASVYDARASENGSDKLLSTGIGARLTFIDHVSLQGNVGIPLVKTNERKNAHKAYRPEANILLAYELSF